MNGNNSQLMVKFITKNKKYAIDESPFSIPASSDAEALSSLVKSVLNEKLNEDAEELKEDLSSLEFDFYIVAQILSTSLDEFVKLNQEIKTESVIEIEYVERCPPPEPFDTIVVDDWVSTIKGNNDCILIGSYDNTVQLWRKGGECVTKLSGHGGAIKAVAWISMEEETSKNGQEVKNMSCKFVSASHDQSIVIWQWSQEKNKVEKTEKCIGHTESVECLDVNSDKSKVEFLKSAHRFEYE